MNKFINNGIISYYFDNIYGYNNLIELLTRYKALFIDLNDITLNFDVDDEFLNKELGIYEISGIFSLLDDIVGFKGNLRVSYKYIDACINKSDLLYKINIANSKYTVLYKEIIIDIEEDLSSYNKLYYYLNNKLKYNIDFGGREVEVYQERELKRLLTNDINSDKSFPIYLDDYMLLLSNHVKCKNRFKIYLNSNKSNTFEEVLSIIKSENSLEESELIFYIPFDYFYQRPILKFNLNSNSVNGFGNNGIGYTKFYNDLLNLGFNDIKHKNISFEVYKISNFDKEKIKDLEKKFRILYKW